VLHSNAVSVPSDQISRTQCRTCMKEGHRSYNCPLKPAFPPKANQAWLLTQSRADIGPTPVKVFPTEETKRQTKAQTRDVQPPKQGAKAKGSKRPKAAPSKTGTTSHAAEESEDLFIHPSRHTALPKKKADQPATNKCAVCWNEGHKKANCPFRARHCLLCGAKSHNRESCPEKNALADQKCTTCGHSGHVAARCSQTQEKRCFVCSKPGHSGRKCPNKKCKLCGGPHLVFSCPKRDQRCLICSSVGHVTRACPEDEINKAQGRCMICDLTGHIAKYCPEKKDAPHLKVRPPERAVTACRLCQSLCHKTKDCTATRKGSKCVQCGSKEHEKLQCPQQTCFMCNTVGHNKKFCPEQYHERLYSVANAPPTATVASLKAAIGPVAEIANVEYLGRSKKFGWCVEFATGEAVQAALSNAVVMGGRTLEFQKGRIEVSERVALVQEEAKGRVADTPAAKPKRPRPPSAQRVAKKRKVAGSRPAHPAP